MAGASSRSGISVNLVIGVFSTAWSAIIAIVSIRWFVKLLGIEAYGLVGFFATMLAAISILDLGLGATVNREVARGAALGDLSRVHRLVASLQRLYGAVALLIGVMVFVSAPLIATRWLSANALDHGVVEWSIRLMGIVAAIRWPIGLFQGTLIGLQCARASYKITAVMATVSNVGAIALLYAVAPTLWTYFTWQVVSAVINLLWMRRSALRELGSRVAEKFNPALMRTLLLQSVTISGVAVTGLLLSQLDKLVVSGSAPLADFGRYSLAALVASALVIILIPTFNVIYPRMSALVAAGKMNELADFYRLGTQVLLCALVPVSASAFFYSADLLDVWTGDRALADSTADIVRLLIVGSTINGVMHFPYTLQLATGNERLALLINVALLVVMLPAMFVLSSRYGIRGGAIGWVVQQSLYFVVGVTVSHGYILKRMARCWLFRDLAPPVVAGVLAVGAGHALAVALTDIPVVRIALASLFALASVAMLAFARPSTRAIVVQFSRRRAAA
jgi:O-antigen/teichoic acid export membrane protein